MENASKALIIAGAILISIVLVSVGVIVVQSLNPDEALSQMDQQAVDSFNSRFTSVEGTNVRGTVVKTMLGNIITSNANNEETKQIAVSFTGATGSEEKAEAASGKKVESSTVSGFRNKVNTSHRYTVQLTYADSGLVSLVTIKDNQNTPAGD